MVLPVGCATPPGDLRCLQLRDRSWRLAGRRPGCRSTPEGVQDSPAAKTTPAEVSSAGTEEPALSREARAPRMDCELSVWTLPCAVEGVRRVVTVNGKKDQSPAGPSAPVYFRHMAQSQAYSRHSVDSG